MQATPRRTLFPRKAKKLLELDLDGAVSDDDRSRYKPDDEDSSESQGSVTSAENGTDEEDGLDDDQAQPNREASRSRSNNVIAETADVLQGTTEPESSGGNAISRVLPRLPRQPFNSANPSRSISTANRPGVGPFRIRNPKRKKRRERKQNRSTPHHNHNGAELDVEAGSSEQSGAVLNDSDEETSSLETIDSAATEPITDSTISQEPESTNATDVEEPPHDRSKTSEQQHKNEHSASTPSPDDPKIPADDTSSTVTQTASALNRARRERDQTEKQYQKIKKKRLRN